MNQNLWWTEWISWSWLANGMDLNMSTSRPTHLTLYWTLTPPLKREFWRIQRGITTRCGFTWKLLNTTPFEQNEPGLTHTKSFTVTPWPECFFGWWYIQGETSQGWSSSTSIIYSDHFPGSVLPPIPAAPEFITADLALIHNGNHYSFWSAPNWYAVLPFAASLRVYKRTDAGWIRQDQANEPTFPAGSFSDMDARISSDFLTFHIVAYCNASAYPPDIITYYTYDIASDSWAISETVAQNTTDRHPRGYCSLSLDSADKPHIVYDGPYRYTHHIYYSNRVTGAWTVPTSFISRTLATWYAMSAAHDTADTFHAAASCYYSNDLWYNHRPAPGPIQTKQLLDTSVYGMQGPGLATWNTTPNLAVRDSDNTLEHFLGPAPWQNDLAISPSISRYPSAITPPTAVNRRYIVFVPPAGTPAGIFWKAGIWTDFPIADPFPVAQLAATYFSPTIFTYITVQTIPATRTRFFAFLPPL